MSAQNAISQVYSPKQIKESYDFFMKSVAHLACGIKAEYDYLTVKEAAEFLKVAPKTIYNLKADGKLKGFNIGDTKKGGVRFLQADLIKFMKGGK